MNVMVPWFAVGGSLVVACCALPLRIGLGCVVCCSGDTSKKRDESTQEKGSIVFGLVLGLSGSGLQAEEVQVEVTRTVGTPSSLPVKLELCSRDKTGSCVCARRGTNKKNGR